MSPHAKFMLATFIVVGGGVTALHGLKGVIMLPEWAVALALAGFGFALIGIRRWLLKADR
jgi:hypothetical protein